jgi:AMMECR1 domain-containing protein
MISKKEIDDVISLIIMYYSLFKRELFDNQKQIFDLLLNKTNIKNIFGVFTTIKRLNEVHGCIGYWSSNFKNLNSNTLHKELTDVSYKSAWIDSRKDNFETPIQEDSNAILEIDFMLNPIYTINIETGIIEGLQKPFTNKKYGIIIQSNDNLQRATYLPEVFPDIKWSDLIVSIKQKANIVSNNFKLFAYKIYQIKSHYLDILNNKLFSYISLYNFSRLLIDNMKLEFTFPFPYTYINHNFEWNKTEEVRNIAILSDIFKYSIHFKSFAHENELKEIKSKIQYILSNLKNYNSQGLSFLGYMYNNRYNDSYNLNIKNKNQYCLKLLNDLETAEPDFARNEILIGLNKAGCSNRVLVSYSDDLNFDSESTIFKMNWIIQALISFNKIISPELILIFKTKINTILKNIKEIETNYIAVAFEGLFYLQKTNPSKETTNILFQLLFELESRKNENNILYNFIDSTARIDITGHIINGLYQLIS